jgi:hypothetical protein
MIFEKEADEHESFRHDENADITAKSQSFA